MPYKNKEKENEHRRKLRKENPEKYRKYHREYQRKWYSKNRDKCSGYSKKYRLKYLEKIRAKDRKIHQSWTICQKCRNKTFGYRKKYCDGCRKIVISEKMKGNQNWKFVKNRPTKEKHHNWRGGVSSVRKQFWDSAKYRNWRKQIFERDNYTCQNCKTKGGFLEAHHIKEREKIWQENNIKTLEDALNCEELWDINNGITLCRKCHNLTKNGKPKCKKS